MNRSSRRWTIVAAGLALLGAAGFWSHHEARRAASAAAGARSAAAACERLAGQIASLRAERAAVAEADTAESELTSVLDASLAEAGLPNGALIRVWPERATRLDRTDYLEKPTRIQLRGATVRQAVAFLLAVAEDGPGVAVRDMRLTVSPDVKAPERGVASATEGGKKGGWNLEATLTQLIYDPRDAALPAPSAVAASTSQGRDP